VRNRVAALSAQYDFPLLAILAIMIAVGLVMVFSASYFRFGVNYFLRQVVWVGVGALVMFITARIPSHWWQRLAIPIMIVALVGLAGVLMFGDDRFGARRTFFGSIQPSEFAKLAVVVYVSTWVASKGRVLADVRGGLIPFAILMGLVASLIVLEPNFSTTIVVLAIGIAIFFVGGADIKQLLVVGLIGILMFVVLLWQSPHAFDRIKGWWDMLGDPTLAPENIRHAIELMRRRDGLAPDTAVWSQKLSVALLWSDYLFANIGADLGLIGQLAVVILYAVLGYRGLGIALNAGSRFSALTAIGVTTWILVQAVMHIGTSIALIPATGQPLPFMSYGGSAMVASMAGIGLLLGIAHESPEKKSVYASFAFGGRDRGTRVPDPGRGGRTDKERRRGR
jgi:cell division protein FtsW